MSEIRPFRGWRFTGALEPRIAPPYDVIADDERDRLASEPENVVHLTLPPGAQEARDYASAARTLRAWTDRGVLAQDPSEALYVLEERTTDGRIRRGLLALVRLAAYDERVILPHERTMRGPKRDRLLLTREVRANLEPLFFLYEDRQDELGELWSSEAGRQDATHCKGPDGTELTLWLDTDPGRLERVRAHLAERSLIIADGHHRYETMLAYRDECRQAGDHSEGSAWVMAYLVNAFDPGSRVQSIHRVLSGEIADPEATLRQAGFNVERLPSDIDSDAVLAELAARAPRSHVFVLAGRDATLCAERDRGAPLDVEVLQNELLPALGGELSFDARPDRLLARARSGDVSLGILLHPIDPETLFRVIEAGTILPQKSTYFAPKIPTGLTIRTF